MQCNARQCNLCLFVLDACVLCQCVFMRPRTSTVYTIRICKTWLYLWRNAESLHRLYVHAYYLSIFAYLLRLVRLRLIFFNVYCAFCLRHPVGKAKYTDTPHMCVFLCVYSCKRPWIVMRNVNKSIVIGGHKIHIFKPAFKLTCSPACSLIRSNSVSQYRLFPQYLSDLSGITHTRTHISNRSSNIPPLERLMKNSINAIVQINRFSWYFFFVTTVVSGIH